MQGFWKKIILFPAGGSGNFLANFLLTDDSDLPQARFRVDYAQKTNRIIGVAPNETNGLANIQQMVQSDKYQIIISHYTKISDLRSLASDIWVKKIYPKTNVFGWIKNMHFKKEQLEIVDYNHMSLSYRVDQCQLFCADWYRFRQNDTDIPNDLIIDFGQMYDIDNLATLFEQANGRRATADRLAWAASYIDQQFPAIQDTDETDLENIVRAIDPQDFFDLAAALFIYEKNHDTVDSNRQWSIDHLPNDLTQAIDFLIDNQKKYTIF